MEEKSEALAGVFEGYLKKRKNIGGLTLFTEWTKRYFVLNLDTFTMVYYKNRKKKGKASVVPLREMLDIIREDSGENENKLSSGKEWGFEFQVFTRSRNFLFNAYSWNDREILLARGLTIDYSNTDKDNPWLEKDDIPEKYDLRDSDFTEAGVVITVSEAYEKYKDEAIRNIEEEERRKIEAEEEKKRQEEGEGEQENQEQNQQNSPNPHINLKENLPQGDGNQQFMTEESFLDRLKEMRNGGSPSPLSKAKRAKKNSSPQQENNQSNSDPEHNDIPDMEQLKNKSKSVKINLKTESDAVEDIGGKDRKASTKRKLKIKNKAKSKNVKETKVEKLVTQEEPQRMNTIAFNEQENEKKKYDFNLEDTDPDLQFDPSKYESIPTKPRETMKLEPIHPNKFDTIGSPVTNPEAVLSNGFHKADVRENLAKAFNPKPPLDRKEPAPVDKPAKKEKREKRRQKTLERPPRPDMENQPKNSLLNKWEQQYGGMKDRQFYVKSDHDYDKWQVENSNKKFSSFNNQGDNYADQEIQEDIPEEQPRVYVENPLLTKKQNKLEGSSSQKEFEYDWDEEESMTYLKKFQDENLKENYNKYGQKTKKQMPVISEYQEKPRKSGKEKKKGKSKLKTERANQRHFKSVAPQIDDWDD